MKALLITVVVLSPAVARGQGIIPVPLPPANGTVVGNPTESVRELRDGRVLFPRHGGGIGVADLDKGTIDSIPEAPGGRLVSLGADSTLVISYRNGWVFLDGTHLLGMLPPSNPVVAAASEMHGVDRLGFVLTVDRDYPADSGTVWLVNRTTARRTAITKTWQGPPARAGIPAPIYVVTETPMLMLDGWTAVVRAHPYRVDWRAPSGQWTRGGPLPVATVPLDAREQAAYWRHFGVTAPDASVRVAWPSVVEPFTDFGPIMATADGRVVIARTWSADFPMMRYDIVNRHGIVDTELMLPAGERTTVIGFGVHSIYTQTIVDAATARIERHPWP